MVHFVVIDGVERQIDCRCCEGLLLDGMDMEVGMVSSMEALFDCMLFAL